MPSDQTDIRTRSPEHTREHQFFSILALAILASAILGFARSYFLVPFLGQPEGNLAFTRLVHLHAVLSFGWCILFVAQTQLVAHGKTQAHRQLGTVGIAWFACLVVTGPVVAVRSVTRYGSTPEDLSFLAVSVGNILAYTLLFGTGLLWRKRAGIHKRFMTLGMVAMLTAPFGRLTSLPFQLDHVVGPGLVVVALAAWDVKSKGRLHSVTLIGGIGILLWELAPNLYMTSQWWLQTAQWLVSQ